MSEIRRRFDPEFREGAVRIVRRPASRSLRSPGIWVLTRARWATGARRTGPPSRPVGPSRPVRPRSSSGCGPRSPNSGWNVMCSSVPWSCG